MLKEMYPNPTEIIDQIVPSPEINARAKQVTKYYDDFIDYAAEYFRNGAGNSYEMKKRFYRCLVNVNILEGIRFYTSFACTFAFGENKLMEGSAKIISFIARDESQHLSITQNIINLYAMKEGDEEMKQVMADCEQDVYDMYNDAVAEEKQWAHHLFQSGSLIGLNEPILCDYVEYMANNRMKSIGLKPVFGDVKHNPLPWTQHWLSSKGNQNAPQETEIESYLIGGIKQDIKEDEFTEFDL